MTKGCRIWLIIGIILLVLALALVIVAVVFGPKIAVGLVNKSLDKTEAELLAKLPPGVEAGEVKAVFAEAHKALEGGALEDAEKATMLQGLVTRMQRVSGKDTLEREEVIGLLHELRIFAGMPKREPAVSPDTGEEMMPPDTAMVDSIATQAP